MKAIQNAVFCLAVAAAGCGDADADPPDPSETPITQIAVGEHVFDVRTAGPSDGEAVILLHGWPQTSYEWRHQLDALGDAGYRAVAPDQRGYSPGARPIEVEAYSTELLRADVLALADALGATRFHLVGHDWGAIVAWGVAALAPERVITLNAVSVPHPDAFAAQLADPSSCQYAASYYFDFFVTSTATDYFVANGAEQLRAVYEGLSASDIDVYVAALGTPAAMDATLNWYRANVADRNFSFPLLGPVETPTLYVWGDQDTALCREGGALSEALVDAAYRFEVMTEVNHWVPDNAGDALASLLLEHLEGHREPL
jgi:pimeloyl-ACP methyl ester carboxylesterase